jgi:hypothetical protein
MTNIFNRSYRFYEKGAPYPGICATCSNTTRLWDLGIIKNTNQGLYLCDTCLTEVATFAGFVLRTQHEKLVDESRTQIDELTTKLDAAPKLIRKLNENVSNILADFVTDLAAINSKPAPSRVETVETSIDTPSADKRNEPKAGEGKKQSVNTGSKSARK